MKTDRGCLLFLYHFSVGKVSLFAVFVSITSPLVLNEFQRDWGAIMLKPLERLVSGIPDKIKFLMGSPILIGVPEPSEILVVTDSYGGYTLLERLMLDILNKRWQVLDLISMMEELKRSVYKSVSWERALITDRLSSRPRFKKTSI